MASLNNEKIELINAHGPFNHSIWTDGENIITQEERLSGRANLLVNKIRSTILKQFTLDELSKMSIADIGCYDGWILNELSDLPFKRMVGIEPREKNIEKGRFIRETLNIKNRVEFKCADFSILNSEKFDIILCLGVFHHLESHSIAIDLLSQSAEKFIFIETICLSSVHQSKAFETELEMKDVVYKYREKMCGMSGQKFESSYYDGSASKLSVVNIPSINTLLMSLKLKFANVKVEVDSETYRKAFKNYDRNFKAVCLSAVVENTNTNNEFDWIKDYEKNMVETIFPKKEIESLYNIVHNNSYKWNFKTFILYTHLFSKGILSLVTKSLINFLYKKEFEREIISNLKYNPSDKLALEYGKILFHHKEYDRAIIVLKGVTCKLNADWRSVYRAYYILIKINSILELSEEAERYKNLLIMSNQTAALTLLD
jgi:hypothetical protein